jgi:hypothetical protein
MISGHPMGEFAWRNLGYNGDIMGIYHLVIAMENHHF